MMKSVILIPISILVLIGYIYISFPTDDYFGSDDFPCSSPNCWNGIIPEVTEFEEAVTIMETSFGSNSLETEVSPNRIQWDYGVIDFDEAGKVSSVMVFYADGELTLGELNTITGEPSTVLTDFVIGEDSNFVCTQDFLVYKEAGLIVWLVGEKDSGINVSSEVFVIDFISPSEAEKWNPANFIRHEWEGYGNYCQ